MKIPKFSAYQIVLEVLSLALMIASLVYIISVYGDLPDEIPGNFNAEGEVTSYSGKWCLWLLFGIELMTYVCFTFCTLSPRVIGSPNMPWKLNTKYAAGIRKEMISLTGECKLLCIALFSFMLVCIIQQTPLKVLPIFAISALMLLSIVMRTSRVSKYKA